MNSFIFTKKAKKLFMRLEKGEKDRITYKLLELKNHPNIKTILVPLQNTSITAYRLRIGKYRLLLEKWHSMSKEDQWLVFDIGHRNNIYR